MEEIDRGWIKLNRNIMYDPILCKDKDTLAIWVYLLTNATYKEVPAIFRGERITLKGGQLITGCLSISEKLMISKSKVQRTLKLFESDKQIEQQMSNKNRLITLLKWDEYFKSDTQSETQMKLKRNSNETQVGTNKKEKKEKKDKKDKNIKESKKEKTFDELIGDYTTNEILKQELKNHLAVRKLKKGALTDRALELSFKKLDELVKSVPVNEQEGMKIKIVQQSIERGWIGFFEVSNGYYQKQKSNDGWDYINQQANKYKNDNDDEIFF